MIKFREQVKIYLYTEHVDFRKAINGLSAIVIDSKIAELSDGDVIIFFNKHKDKVKILFWDRNGFVLYYKCLSRTKFKIPKNIENDLELTLQQLDWLLAGLDFKTMDEFNELNYCNYY